MEICCEHQSYCSPWVGSHYQRRLVKGRLPAKALGILSGFVCLQLGGVAVLALLHLIR
jgi:hypothetical protein